MPLISPSQLRAARGLLNWSRDELAKLSGISKPTLHRFENGINEPETRTANKLIEVFNQHGVEFSEHQGVRFKPSNIDIYDGAERFSDFYDFLYEHLDQFGGDVCISIYDESWFARFRKNPSLHLRRMQKLFAQGKITFRLLVTKSDFQTFGYAQFRWLPKQLPTPTGFYAFGDCLALISFVGKNPPHVVVLRSSSLADGYRKSFDVAWEQGKPPPPASEIAKMWPKDLPPLSV